MGTRTPVPDAASKLTETPQDRADAAEVAAELAWLERGPGGPSEPYRADGYVYATHPDLGDAVVFLPGERLPEWAIPADERAPVDDPDGAA